MTTLAAAQAALAVAHQVVYGYGVVVAKLAGHARTAALRRLVEHQLSRDRLADIVHVEGGVPVAARPAYALPFSLSDAMDAYRLAASLEDAVAGTAWDLVAMSAAASHPRQVAVDALGDAAAWATWWRSLTTTSGEPALPGQPEPSQPSTTPTSSPSSSITPSGSTS
ncbi:MAG: hypothetical protein QOJ03_3066 [Frankiaceae bacterium]|nr:hypothetical protein [Frankiaceae bacterium]